MKKSPTFNLQILSLSISILISCGGNESESVQSQSYDTSVVASDSTASNEIFSTFITYVNNLPNKIESIDSAFAKFENTKSTFTQEEKDSSYFVIYDFMTRIEMEEANDENVWEIPEEKLDKKYNKFGLLVWWSEGYPYLVPDQKYLQKKFKKDASVELYEYLDLEVECNIIISSDAGIIITWDELADLVLTCEEYLIENSESKYAEKALDHYQSLLSYLMWGLDNTPIVDAWTQEPNIILDTEVSKTYNRLINDKKYKTGRIIADHLTWLESVEFKYMDLPYEDLNTLSREEIKLYLGI